MDQKVIGILRDISQLIVATLVEKDDEKIVVENPTFLGISAQGPQVNVQFIPVEALSLQPVVQLRNFLANTTEKIQYTFYRKHMLKDEVELSEQIIENYLKTINPSQIIVPDKKIATPDENIVKLF